MNFQYADLPATLGRYPVDRLREGFNELPDGEQVFFIPTPSAGLWSTREKLFNRPTAVEA